MNKTLVAATVAALSLPMAAHADTIFGLYLSAGQWNEDFTGTFASGSSNANDLSFDSDSSTADFESISGSTLSIALEHPIPVLPNIRLSSTELDQTGTQTFATTFTYNGTTYNALTPINAEMDLSHIDYLLYYEVLDNWVSIDLGINVRHFNGFGEVSGTSGATTQTERTEFKKAYIPMLYARADFQLPLTGLSLGGEVMGISAGDASMKDIKVRIAYESSIGLGIELGQRSFSVKYDPSNPDDKDVIADIDFKGTYGAVTFHF